MGDLFHNITYPPDIKLGTLQVDRIYCGTEWVWPRTTTTTTLPTTTTTTTTIALLNYGLLYNWYAANDSRNIAPLGWHVPTRIETSAFETFLGGGSNGLKIKEVGTTHWTSNTGTDNYGFGSRGSGTRINNTGLFNNITTDWYIWNFGDRGVSSQYFWGISNGSFYTNNVQSNKQGYSLRIVKDDSTYVSSVTGNDGKIYPCVSINSKVWTSVNIAETKYRNGDSIPEITNNTTWTGLTSGALCAYNNDWLNV